MDFHVYLDDFGLKHQKIILNLKKPLYHIPQPTLNTKNVKNCHKNDYFYLFSRVDSI